MKRAASPLAAPSNKQVRRSDNVSRKEQNTPDVFRVLSWNVDRPDLWLLPRGAAAKASSTSISAFFSPVACNAAHPSSSAGGARSAALRGIGKSQEVLPPADKKVAPGRSGVKDQTVLHRLLAENDFPDFLFLQEIRARPSDKDQLAALREAPHVASSMRDTESRKAPRYQAYFACNKAEKGMRFHGVATYVREDRTSEITSAREVDWDSEGRIHIVEMAARGVAFINVYALNGSDNLYSREDPATLLEDKPSSKYVVSDRRPQTRNERKRQFNQLLMYEVQSMRERGLRPVLMGDFNISRSHQDAHPRLRLQPEHVLSREHFNDEVMPGMGVVDVYREGAGPDGRAYSWFSYGRPTGEDCYRVDFALADKHLYEGGKVKMEYLAQVKDSRGDVYSDHAPMKLELDLPSNEAD